MYDVNFPSKSDHFSIIYDFKIESYDTSALNYCNQISHNVVFDLSKQEQINSNMDQHNNSIDNVDNGNRCRSPSIRRHDDPSLVIVDVEAAELLQQSAYPTHQQQQLIDEQALLKTVTVNRGAVQRTTKMRKILKRLLGFIIHVCCSVGLFAMCQYLVGIDKQLKSIPYVVLFYYQIIIVTLLLAWKKFIKDWVYGDMDVFTREMAKSQIVEINSNPRIHNRKRRQSIPMITASLQSFENKLNTL
ncbi:uncharacterized protein LOC126897646 isoform X5 [Daktulosphaira vitifoliae]|uniref:uncharacterized protein LOC126897646 isoform X5 n=1 Tax=Daktulosphaira vitifoliae TaxID=58002 RepID=UPI0021A9810B|nr:uncharacterized protein LOC126897646 isoform X5 [Daktulosphaira vitifoliae]